MNRCVRFLLLLLLTFSLTSCNGLRSENTVQDHTVAPLQGEGTSKSPSPMTVEATPGLPHSINTTPGINLVRKTEKTRYLLTNGIEIKNQEKSLKTIYGETFLWLPQISGLVDKKVEEKVNKAIMNDVEKEAQSFIAEVGRLPYSLYCEVQLNANNLLSISMNEHYSLPHAGFLYRLSDGNRLHLKDIFTQGTEYIPLVNQKVVEAILRGEREESDLLKKPFSTIKPDQSFALTSSILFTIFHANESGFAERTAVAIPLSFIDDYVNVMDLYSGTERKNHERLNLIVRSNNIFNTPKGEIRERKNGNVWAYYPEIAGLRNTPFEETINKTIRSAVDEVVNGKYLDGITKNPNQRENRIAIIQMYAKFNHYGILSIARSVYADNANANKNLEKLFAIYSFDLINKKQIDTKALLANYIAKNRELEEILSSKVKEELKKQVRSKDSKIIREVDSRLHYSYIMKNAFIYFNRYSAMDETTIVVHLNEAGFDSFSDHFECYIPFKEIIKIPPEDFFGW